MLIAILDVCPVFASWCCKWASCHTVVCLFLQHLRRFPMPTSDRLCFCFLCFHLFSAPRLFSFAYSLRSNESHAHALWWKYRHACYRSSLFWLLEQTCVGASSPCASFVFVVSFVLPKCSCETFTNTLCARGLSHTIDTAYRLRGMIVLWMMIHFVQWIVYSYALACLLWRAVFSLPWLAFRPYPISEQAVSAPCVIVLVF